MAPDAPEPEPPEPPPSLPAALASRFRVEASLGRGAMGRVLRVRDLELDRPAALKLLPELPDPEAVRRFRREAEALARLRHPHVVRLLQFGEEGPTPFLLMELVEGTSLARALPKARVETGLAWLLQVAEALEAVHAAGLVHRDLKPANVMVSAQGRAILVDFGLVRDADRVVTRLTRDGSLVGTLAYLPPECLRGAPADAAADWYAWGAMLFELLEGRFPFRAEQVMAMAMGSAGTPSPVLERTPADDPRGRLALLQLSPDPARRLRSRDALEAVLAGRAFPPPTRAPSPPPGPTAQAAQALPGPPSRRPAGPLALAAALLALALGLGSSRPPAPSPHPDPDPGPAVAPADPAPLEAARARLQATLAPVLQGYGDLLAPGGFSRARDDRVRVSRTYLAEPRLGTFSAGLDALLDWLSLRTRSHVPLAEDERSMLEGTVFPWLGRAHREDDLAATMISWATASSFGLGPSDKPFSPAQAAQAREVRVALAERAQAAWARLPRLHDTFADHGLVLDALLGGWGASGDVPARVAALVERAGARDEGPLGYWLRRAAAGCFPRVLGSPMPDCEGRAAIGRLMLDDRMDPPRDLSNEEWTDLACERILTWLWGEPGCGMALAEGPERASLDRMLLNLEIQSQARTRTVKPWMWILQDQAKWIAVGSSRESRLTAIRNALDAIARR